MPVDTLNPAYTPHEMKARRVRDAVEGTDAVKARAKSYLRNPDPDDAQRFIDYVNGAQWLNVTRRTLSWMVGAIYRKAPQVEMPNALEPLRQDADGSGQSLTQFARNVTSQAIINGRHGVLVEYPEAEPGATLADSNGRHATLKSYASQSIINWRMDGDRLVLVVLRETYDHLLDEFEAEEREQFRVLSLDEGQYLQRVFRDNQEVSRIEPRMANGQRWREIPFQFIGVVNNDTTPDNPLLLDLADTNFLHFRSSADRYESSFIVGQPLYHVDIGETDSEEWRELNPNGITVGSRRGIQTQGGKVEIVQAAPNDMSRQDMLDALENMQKIGARLIDQRGGNETAEAVRERSGSDTANLSTVADNVSDGLENCLEWAAGFMTTGDVSDQITVELNREFYQPDADPQSIMAVLAMADRGLMADTDVWQWSRERGLIDSERTDEDLRAEGQVTGLGL